MKDFKKRVLILGGSSDIGIQLIQNLLEDNWKIVAHYSSRNDKLIKLKHKNLNLVQMNFKKINEKNYSKKIDIFYKYKYDAFVNLIGFIDNRSLNNTNLKSLLEIFKINSFIPMLIMKKIVKSMLKNSYGRILNCSSIGVKFGGGEKSFNYSFSKHSVEFIPNIYKQWSKNDVLINNLRIGVTNTKIHKKMKKVNSLKRRIDLIPVNRMATTKEIVNYILFLISHKNSYMTGETITASGGE